MDGCRSRRIGIVGFGNLGQYLVDEIHKRDDFELAFVWNRNPDAMVGRVDEKCILHSLDDVTNRDVDLIVEVAHPSITAQFGELFLKTADFMVGSPTAFADENVEKTLRSAAANHNGCYIPSGAFWGGEDIKKMADRGTLKGLKITMTKHPSCFKLVGPLKETNDNLTEKTALYDGPVRGLCPVAPNNVNTMAAAAIAGHNLGFDKVQGSIISDPGLTDWHLVEVETLGPGDGPEHSFHVHTVRKNPAKPGVVTGNATYASFLSSMLGACGKGKGVHLC